MNVYISSQNLPEMEKYTSNDWYPKASLYPTNSTCRRKMQIHNNWISSHIPWIWQVLKVGPSSSSYVSISPLASQTSPAVWQVPEFVCSLISLFVLQEKLFQE